MGNKNNINTHNTINKKELKKYHEQKFKLKDFNINKNSTSIVNILNKKFEGFRCIKCLSLLYFKITKEKNDNGEMIIEIKCKNNHKETKTINELLKIKNNIKFTDEFQIHDNVYNNNNNGNDYDYAYNMVAYQKLEKTQNDPFSCARTLKYCIDEEDNYYYDLHIIKKYFYICNTCKIIFYDKHNNFDHEHPTYRYVFRGNVYDGMSSKYYLEYENKKICDNKINTQINYYEKINKIILDNNLKDKIGNYLDLLSNEIKFINEIKDKYEKKKTKYNHDNYISIIFNIKLSKFNTEKYKNYLNKNIISEINKLNEELEKNEKIKYYNSGRISLLYYKIFNNEKYNLIYNKDAFILDKDHFIIVKENEMIIYKKELIQNENKKDKTLRISIKLNINIPITKMVLLNNNRISGIYMNNLYIISFNNDFSSYKLEKTIEINNLNKITLFSNGYLVLYGSEMKGKIKFYKEIKNNEFQNIAVITFVNEDINNIIEINKSLFAFTVGGTLYFYNKKKFNKVYKNSDNIYSSLFLLKNNVLAILNRGHDKIFLMNIKTRVIFTNIDIEYEKLFDYQSIKDIYDLGGNNLLINFHFCKYGRGASAYLFKTIEYLKTDDKRYEKGNLIDTTKGNNNKILKFVDDSFLFLKSQKFMILYLEK